MKLFPVILLVASLSAQGLVPWHIVNSGTASYLDSTNLTSALMICGLSKLVRTYSGPCITVRRSSDSATQDIGWVGQRVDIPAVRTFIGAGSAFVAQWYDQTGNGNHLTNGNTALHPQLLLAGYQDHYPSVLITGINGGITVRTLTNTMIVPSSLSVSVYAVCKAQNEYSGNAFWLYPFNMDFGNGGSSAKSLYYWSGVFAKAQWEPWIGNGRFASPMFATDTAFSIYLLSSSNSAPRFRRDWEVNSLGNATGQNIATTNFGLNLTARGASEMRSVAVYTTPHSTNTQNAIFRSMQLLHGGLPRYPRTKAVWWHGDSLSGAYIPTADHRENSPANLMANALPAYIVRCNGKAGYKVSQIDADATTYQNVMSNEVSRVISVLWGGYNNYFQGSNTVSLYNEIGQFCTNRINTGNRVVLCNLIETTGIASTNIADINALLAANWTNFAHAYVNMHDLDWSGKKQGDGIHLLSTGNQQAADAVKTAIIALSP